MARGRLILMAQPASPVLDEIGSALASLGLVGTFMFARENLHQSLSNVYADTLDALARMTRAGDMIAATAAQAKLSFNRITGSGVGPRGIHWELRARGKPADFVDLVASVGDALRAQGMEEETGHTPHITISYEAPRALTPCRIEPIDWTIDEFRLVRGGGEPFRYEVLRCWPLRPITKIAARQMSLF